MGSSELNAYSIRVTNINQKQRLNEEKKKQNYSLITMMFFNSDQFHLKDSILIHIVFTIEFDCLVDCDCSHFGFREFGSFIMKSVPPI